jgi:hypothetical protein
MFFDGIGGAKLKKGEEMTRDDITRMAREAGFVGFDGDNGSLRRFAALVAEAEREACAKLTDAEADWWPGNSHGLYASRNIAAAIRGRGEK